MCTQHYLCRKDLNKETRDTHECKHSTAVKPLYIIRTPLGLQYIGSRHHIMYVHNRCVYIHMVRTVRTYVWTKSEKFDTAYRTNSCGNVIHSTSAYPALNITIFICRVSGGGGISPPLPESPPFGIRLALFC